MINAAAYALCLALSQDPAAEPAAPPAEAPAAAAPATEGGDAAAPAPAGPARPKGADDVARVLAKVKGMTDQERAAALEGLRKQWGSVDTNPVLPTADIDLEKYLGLPPEQQVEVVARGFFTDLISGDTNRLLARSGYPFFAEARRLDRPEELRAHLGKTLRSRRADLLKLYSIEVLLPADMEKKYGKAPQRLSGWNLRSPNTFVAVGNLSGHAAILLLRQAGAAWQVVGFHD